MSWLEISDEDVMSIVEPIMNNLMDASTKIDHPSHVRDFSDKLKDIVTKENLESQCREYQTELGFFAERKLIGIIKKKTDVRVFWKQWYTKTTDEYLAFIHIKKQNGKYTVVNVSVS